MDAGAIVKVPDASVDVAWPVNARVLPWLSVPVTENAPPPAIEPVQAIVMPPLADPLHDENAPVAPGSTAVKLRSELALVEAHAYVPA